jgi:hypothetical protein
MDQGKRQQNVVRIAYVEQPDMRQVWRGGREMTTTTINNDLSGGR